MRAAEMLDLKERSACSTSRCPGPSLTAREASRRARRRPTRGAGAGVGGDAAPDSARPGGAADPGATARRVCVLGPLADQDPEDWLGAYSSHAKPPPGAGDDAARGHPRALARGDLRPRLRLRRRGRRRRAEIARSGGGAGRGRDAHPALPRRAARRGAASWRRWPIRGCPSSSGGWSRRCGREPRREARRLRDRRAGAPHSGRSRGGRRRAFLDGAHRHFRRRSDRRHPCRACATRRRACRTACQSPTGSPRASTRGRRGSTGRRCRWCAGSAARRQRHHWCAYYLGLGARWPAAYYFGEGYSYTTFELSDWALIATHGCRLRAADARRRSVRVTNTGSRPGTETVHLYYQDMVCEERVPRLLERLGHQQATLGPGRVRDARLRGRAGDAGEVRPRPRRRAAGLARPRPGGRTPTGCSSSSTRGRRSTRSSASATRLACSPSPWSRERIGDDLGLPARRPEQHGRPRRRRRHVAMARSGAVRDAGRRARRADCRDPRPRGQRRSLADRQALRGGLPRRPSGRRGRLRSRGGRWHELLEPPLEPG